MDQTLPRAGILGSLLSCLSHSLPQRASRHDHVALRILELVIGLAQRDSLISKSDLKDADSHTPNYRDRFSGIYAISSPAAWPSLRRYCVLLVYLMRPFCQSVPVYLRLLRPVWAILSGAT